MNSFRIFRSFCEKKINFIAVEFFISLLLMSKERFNLEMIASKLYNLICIKENIFHFLNQKIKTNESYIFI